MSAAEDYRAIVGRLRSWGFTINETAACYSRSNGLNWARGVPVGHGNHHYVCSMNPAQAYINSLVVGLMNGNTVNWFADVNGTGYLIGAGPMNHFGQGNSSVLARTVANQPPPGPSNSAGDMTGNTWYSGTELQHPGDSTPYPPAMVDLMVAISAAEAMQWGWSADRVIDHYEWTGRKIDMSLWGGRASSAAGDRMRAAVRARMGGSVVGPTPDKPAPTPGAPAPLPTMDEDDTMRIAVATDSDNGAVFAFGPNRFIYLNGDQLAAGIASGLLDGDRSHDYRTTKAGLDLLRDVCVGNGQGKGDNLIHELPSAIATKK